jgi:methylmalonyl-CoA mutase cobalamin-binding domain/chain
MFYRRALNMTEIFCKIADAVGRGDREEVARLADEVIANKVNPVDAIQKGGIVGLNVLGDKFERLEAYLPELMLGGEAMKVLIDKLTPYMENAEMAFEGKVVIGTVKGDLHDIGKNLVSTTLSVNGFNVVDLGVDVSTNKFLEKAQEEKADIIAMSSLLTTSAYYMEETINRLKHDGLKDRFKIIVGGGPIDPEWARKIGSDGYARTSVGAAKVCKELVKQDVVKEFVIGD